MHELTQHVDRELRVGLHFRRSRGPVRIRPRARDAHGQRVGMLDHELGPTAADDIELLSLEWVMPADYLHPFRCRGGRGVLLSL